MQNTIHRYILMLFLLSPFIGIGQFKIDNLQVDYQQTPLGIDTTSPVFSWKMTTDETLRGQFQYYYQMEVWDENGLKVWDSKKVQSGISVGITYNGEALQPVTRYTWSVTVWNQEGKQTNSKSWFETGLMNPDPKLSAWDGAGWIGGSENDLVFYSHYLSVYKLKYGLQLDKNSKSTKAAFIFGANDERLMDKNMNTRGMQSPRDASYIKLELDISKVDGSNTGLALLNIYRVGYAKDDSANTPFKSIQIPLALINKDNKYQKHEILASAIFGVFDFYIDGEDELHRVGIGDTGKGLVNLNPEGWGADYIAYPVMGDIGFSLAKGQKASFSNVAVMNNRAPSNILFQEDLNQTQYNGIFKSEDNASFSASKGEYRIDGSQKPVVIIANPSKSSSPMLRTEFTILQKPIKKARIYATARGIYELYMNGKRIGNEYFSPGLTQYNKTQLYQTYDVTDILSNGANAFGAILSEGWWSGNITFTGNHWNFFGDRQSLLAKLVITYQDGSEQVITTNPDTWSYFNEGPILYGSFFQGEVYDGNKEATVLGWDKAGYNDARWKKAQIVTTEGTTYNGTTTAQGEQVKPDFSAMQLIGMPGVTATIVKKIKPVAVEEVRPGVFVYDMGQNMVGFPRIQLENAAKGDTVMVRYAEIKYPDLEQYSTNKGMVMVENLRAAMVRDVYYCKGTNDIMQPRFTYHGYRYIEITGIKRALPLENITTLVLSSIDTITAGYETSNPLVNKLWKNIEWSTRANFLYIPTDTPARNERMGWSGDISVFSKTATYMANLSPFLKRHMLAMRDLQYKNGRFTDTAPVTDAFGGILWGSAGIIVPWESYQQYGDVALLSDHYDAMKHYIEFIKTRINTKTGIIDEGPLGDWLSPENYKTDDTILWDAYYVYDLDIMRQVAKILGRSEDAIAFENEYIIRKAHFNITHIDQPTGKTLHTGHRFPWGYNIANDQLPQEGGFSDTQASYAIPLAFGVINKDVQAKVSLQLAKAVLRKNKSEDGIMRPEYSLMTGFIGTAAISKALSLNGYDSEAYTLLQQTSYPSWLYSVENGATTIWERLNSYTKDKGFGTNNSMNSFNHYSFGAVGAWMINYSLGIERDEPGFKKIILQPTPDPTGKMTYANGFYDSMYGKIASEWRTENEQTVYTLHVPANTSATIYLVGSDIAKVTESGKKIGKAKGVTFNGTKDNKLVFTITSGTYTFIIQK
jgi:alpha-L-rhamnosidase